MKHIFKEIKGQRVTASFRGIDQMGSVLITLLQFRLAHIHNKETSGKYLQIKIFG